MEHIYNNIEGWFTFPELYRDIVKIYNNAHFVEVGSWMGCSASFMAVEIVNSNKNIKFDCVDTWCGSKEHGEMDIIKDELLYQTFLKNIEPVKHVITPIRLTSLDAAKKYQDKSLDFVFIDASHEYDDVKNDIEAWYPKVKNNGILAGHDYPSWDGVTRAVNEWLLKNNFKLNISQELCWGIYKN